jgi:iron-only hydrogenase group A
MKAAALKLLTLTERMRRDKKMVQLTINNIKVDAEEGMTILDAAKSVGIAVPTLCHIKDLVPSGACRICSVEVDGYKGLVPACAYPVSEGMVVGTNTPRVRMARKTIVELLVENHPQDCLICVRNKNCELQDLSEQYGLREHRYVGEKKDHAIDVSSASMERDPAKCILCGRCVRICHEIQKVGAIDFTNRGFQSIVTTPYNKGLNVSDCILCGQCILVCPTAALREKSSLKAVASALQDKNKFTVVQVAPAVRATLGEEYNLPLGTDVTGQLVTALRRLGFKKVFDTNFAADLTIIEEASELLNRVKNGGNLPMFTSCCPGWVKYAEQNLPEILDNISTCKSPHEMEGAVLKTYYAKKMGIEPENIFVCSVMPCTVKKYESDRGELSEENYPDVDAVITTRELVRFFKMAGIDFNDLPNDNFDNPLGESTGAAAIFGTSGGVMEAALRTAYFKLAGVELEKLEFEEIRGSKGVKEATVKVNGMEINVAVVNGIGNVKEIAEDVKRGVSKYHFIEVMACPGGCINGGGQPIHQKQDKVIKRMRALYQMDEKSKTRRSHENESVKALYKEYFIEPNSHKAHSILHTHYFNRKKNINSN